MLDRDLSFDKQLRARLAVDGISPDDVMCTAATNEGFSTSVTVRLSDNSVYAVGRFSSYGELVEIKWSSDHLGVQIKDLGLLGISRFPGMWEGQA